MEKNEEALIFAKKWHGDQKRKDGITPYYQHPLDVYNLLKRVDSDNVLSENHFVVALLHDVLEDTDCTFEEIKNNFGIAVANLVSEISFFESKENPFAKAGYISEISKKIYSPVFLVKIADRICNTNDFLLSENYAHAKNYFHKADILFCSLFKKINYDTTKRNADINLFEEVMKLQKYFHKKQK